ncbi:hypothetical protein EYF80_001262 [Liparis tanakae]|uniref:Uncharacterized protein n=1 Tax=Liparis tanakae TaxID=230148 RepID=A0A4Z2JE72_9TELE|nr:hypothetical protein EYF80_001262 [Liparis tanakae]
MSRVFSSLCSCTKNDTIQTSGEQAADKLTANVFTYVLLENLFFPPSLSISHPLHLALDLPHAAVPLLPLAVEALHQVSPLAAPPLLSVLQLPAEVQRGVVAVGQQTPLLLALQLQAPLGVFGRFPFTSLSFASDLASCLLLQLLRLKLLQQRPQGLQHLPVLPKLHNEDSDKTIVREKGFSPSAPVMEQLSSLKMQRHGIHE